MFSITTHAVKQISSQIILGGVGALNVSLHYLTAEAAGRWPTEAKTFFSCSFNNCGSLKMDKNTFPKNWTMDCMIKNI